MCSVTLLEDMAVGDIQVSRLGQCHTILFQNKAMGRNALPTIWVCTCQRVYQAQLYYLQGLDHIKILSHGGSLVQDEMPRQQYAH